MTIASTNIGFSTIAAEKGIGNSNLSLATLAGGQMKLPLANDSSSTSSEYGTFDQVWYYGSSYRSGSTVTSAQGQGVNGLNAAPHSMSEWVGFDPNTDGYSIAGSDTYPAVYTYRSDSLEDLPNNIQEARDQMERRLLEHYSATGRGIPIQVTERG